MGIGIAIALADAGVAVVLIGRQERNVDAACARVARHYAAAVEKGLLTEQEMESRLDRIIATTSWHDLVTVDFAIEAVIEELGPKLDIFAKLAIACRPDAILATNTSSLDIDPIAGASGRPERVIGLHFFSPAHATKLVEIVRSEKTADLTVATAKGVARQLRKSSVVVRTGDGLVSTRMFVRYLREANLLLLEGAAPHEIDAAMVRFGMAMGPFAISDLAGIDVLRQTLAACGPMGATGCDADALFDSLVERGRWGLKSNRGYYRYETGGRSPAPDPDVDDLIVDVAKQVGRARRSIPESEVVDRCVRAMADEGVSTLKEGFVDRASDLDVIWVDAYGFPRHRGGPLYHAERGGMHAA